MSEVLTKVVICCAEHDHATDPLCEHKAAEAIVPLTTEEITAREELHAQQAIARAEQEAEQVAYVALKESAKAKLIAGQPLTEEEAATIVL